MNKDAPMRLAAVARLLVGIVLGGVLAAGSAMAAEFKIATVAPEGSQWMQDIRAAAGEIRDRTQSRVTIKLYGGGVMGNEKQVLRKIRVGQLHGGAFTAGGLAQTYPDIVIYGLPLVFRSPAEVTFVRERMDGELARGLEAAGFVSFGIAGGGFARIFGNEPVTGTESLRGRKVWVPDGDLISAAAMQALHLSPVALPITDVLTGLQTGLLDIIAAPPVGVIALQWHTRVRYMTTQPMMYSCGLMAVDAKAFKRLSPADQAVFREVMSAVYRRFDQQSIADDKAARDAIQAAGIRVVEANVADVTAWQDAMVTVNRDLGAQGVYSPRLLEELQGHLQDYRRQHPAADAAARQ